MKIPIQVELKKSISGVDLNKGILKSNGSLNANAKSSVLSKSTVKNFEEAKSKYSNDENINYEVQK